MADITDQYREHLAKQYEGSYEERNAQAVKRQREIAQQSQGRKSVEGLGQAVMEVDATVHQEWIKKEGSQIWKDPEFRKYMAKNNPELKVKNQGSGKIQVGYGS
tara:strand:- start:1323 stop:1634 length:312 start_codon:yes stop_codon:yes gene_type:complete